MKAEESNSRSGYFACMEGRNQPEKMKFCELVYTRREKSGNGNESATVVECDLNKHMNSFQRRVFDSDSVNIL